MKSVGETQVNCRSPTAPSSLRSISNNTSTAQLLSDDVARYPMLRSLFRPVTSRLQIGSRVFSSTAGLSRAVDMEQVNTTDRLKHVRELMQKNKVDIYSRAYPSAQSLVAD